MSFRARSLLVSLVLVLGFLPLAAEVPAPARALPFSDGGWELKGEAAVARVDGRETLQIDSGIALRRDVKLEDGTIELDVKVTRRRSFVYLTFRMADERELEEVYLRPHKSSLPDAIQYAPVYQGQSAWQLHHGPGATAAVAFEPDVWTHVRLVLSGRRAALYVGDLEKPALLIPRLAREGRPGFIGLRGFLPPDLPRSASTGAPPIARFSNVSVRPGFVPVDLATLPMPPVRSDEAAIRAWAVSGPLPEPAGDGVPRPPDASTTGAFRRVEALSDGLVELHRHVTVPAGRRELTAAARVRVTAEAAGTRLLELGFSDRAVVFLNGTPVFRGEASYSFAGRREGLIGFEQARLYLPLRAGENEVLVVVSDSFGGMGLMGRFPDGGGLEVAAR